MPECGAFEQCVTGQCEERSLHVAVTGDAELVWDQVLAGAPACALADGPFRMYRDADGRAWAILSGPFNYRLRSAVPDGRFSIAPNQLPQQVFRSPQRTTESAYDSRFWIMGLWTDDGVTIRAVAHHEWYHPSLYGVEPPPRDCAGLAHNVYGWINAVHHLSSTNGGAAFETTRPYLPEAASNADRPALVPEPYAHEGVLKPLYPHGEFRYGFFHPSNIVKEDKHYYLVAGTLELVRDTPDTGTDYRIALRHGFVLARTTDISDTWVTGTWELWSGATWNKISGALFNGEAHVFTDDANAPQPRTVLGFGDPAARASLFSLTFSLTYNEVARAWLLLGHNSARAIVFTATASLAEPNFTSVRSVSGAETLDVDYPTIVDPGSDGKVYMYSGARPWLYFVRVNTALERQVFRRPLTISLQ